MKKLLGEQASKAIREQTSKKLQSMKKALIEVIKNKSDSINKGKKK